MLIFLSTTGKFTFENNAKSYQNIRFSNNLVTRFMPEQYNWMKYWATCAVCTSQQKVDTFFIFYTLKTEHSTPYIVLVSNSLMSMQVFLH